MNRNTAMCQACVANAAQAGEYGVRDNAERHRAHAAQAIAQPAEHDAARRGADEKRGHDDGEPLVPHRGVLRRQELGERLLSDERKHPHLEAVEQPTQERGRQGHPLAALAVYC